MHSAVLTLAKPGSRLTRTNSSTLPPMHPTFSIGLSLHSCEDDKIEQSKVCEPINQQHDGASLSGRTRRAPGCFDRLADKAGSTFRRQV